VKERTWGYSGQVGEWFGAVEIPPEGRNPSEPLATIARLLVGVAVLLEELHRPRRVLVSWGEYDAEGTQEDFHELETAELCSFAAIAEHVERLSATPGRRAAVSYLCVELETRISEEEGESWMEESATLEISVTPPELQPESAGIVYTTYIDAWLSTTYGPGDAPPRANHTVAARNRPRLEALLRALASFRGGPFTVGHSRTYPFAICATGFRDVDVLPP
jgi:hypothetical protein